MSVGRRWLRDRRGITSIEYGLIGSLVALGLVASLNSVGTKLSTVFSALSDGLGGGSRSAPPPATANAIHQ